ncbi:MAG TPA: N-6 DNA methylase [Myxococcaceae bacterium]|nr:N-6 DNA methylase [Myxococcaceae bacterium]
MDSRATPLAEPPCDEESLVEAIPAPERKAHGAFFTPSPLVGAVFDAVIPHLPASGPLAVIDPACGAGAFLAAAAQRLPRARLLGLEIHPEVARRCRARVPRAQVLTGDALREQWDHIAARIPSGAFELWIGNPPYNGTSALLRDPTAYRAIRALFGGALPRGQSLRDDYAFFLLRAAARSAAHPGAIAFITSATLLDAFLYAPLRHALLERLHLREVIELGPGAFRETRVRTCITVWTSPGGARAPVRYRSRPMAGPFAPSQLGTPIPHSPAEPDWILRPAPADAVALDRSWRAEGEPITRLVPISTPGLKTRFDELLVDDDPARLVKRLEAFAATPLARLRAFARAFDIPTRHLEKLAALRASLPGDWDVDPVRIRPFYRYRGARHRGSIPESARAFCYLDRRLIPRGDHRLRGGWDPHACAVKLVFNVRELPLSAALLDRPGCVHDHRHARFAPLYVPRLLQARGLGAARPGVDLGPDVPNLSERGLAWAKGLGGERALFEALVRFVNSEEVQKIWAPAFGAVRELHVPARALGVIQWSPRLAASDGNRGSRSR